MKKYKLVVFSMLVCLMLVSVSAYAASSATVTLKNRKVVRNLGLLAYLKKQELMLSAISHLLIKKYI